MLSAPVIVGLVVVGVLWTYRPPDIAKPAWLRAEERRDGKPHDPNPRLARFEKFAVMLIFLPLALAGIMIILGAMRWLVLGR